jgi:NAD(P)-dependent dehydrogenase (short-subunit alcohol dehydrogenase family)
MRLQDKIAIITGASKGIGRAIALGYAREGAHVVLAARSSDLLEEVAGEVRALGRQALAVPTDVIDEEAIKNMVGEALDEFGRIDVLVNNAGVGMFRPVWGTPLKTWEWIIGVNLRAPFLCTKHVWKPMKQGGGGVIVNIGSLSGSRAEPMYSAYAASKWGLNGFTKSVAEEGKEDNIRVNLIAPGKVDSEMRARVAEDKSQILTVENCVGLAVFLASDEAEHIHGQIIELERAGADINRSNRKNRKKSKEKE